MALRALRANLLRTILTLLGIVIGVGSVVAMLAIGEGAQAGRAGSHRLHGNQSAGDPPGAPNQRGVGNAIATLMPQDADAIATLPNVSAAVPELSGSVTVRFGNSDYQTTANGTTADLPAVRDWPVAAGTFFTRDGRHALCGGGRARPDRGRQHLSRRRRSGRQVRLDQQRAVPGHRRHGAEGRHPRATTWTTWSSCRFRPAACACSGSAIVRTITVAVSGRGQHRCDPERGQRPAARAPPDRRTSRSATWRPSWRRRQRRRTR